MSAPAQGVPAPSTPAVPGQSNASLDATPTQQAQQAALASPEAPAAATQEAQEAKKTESSKKRFELKVNGKPRVVDVDLSDDKSLQDYMQKALAADERFQEAAILRKDVQLLVKTLKDNPLAILTHPDIGVDIKQLAQQVINQELEDMNKTPEQKKMEQLEKDLQKERDARTQMEEQARQSEIAKQEAEQFQQIDDQIAEGLAATDLPKTPYVVKRISDSMIAAFDMGYHDVTVKDIIPIVEKQLKEEMGQWFDESSEDALEKLMGKNLERIRKKRMAASKKAAPTAQSIKPTAEGSKAPEKTAEGTKKQRFEDIFGKF